jgi:glycosyltransferase involved in cell wall biosynthesis
MSEKFDRFVVIFGPEIWSLQQNGGVSRYCYELIRNLQNLGIEARVLQTKNNNDYTKKLDPNTVHKIKSHRKKDVKDAIASVMQNFDRGIYHATYYSLGNLKVAKEFNLKTIVTVHDLIGDILPTRIKWYQRRNLEQERTSKVCDELIAVSHNTKNDIKKFYGINGNKITVTHLGVSEMKSNKSISEFAEIPFVLHVGKRNGYKNFALTLEAIAECEALKYLNIVAFGGGEITEEEMVYITEAKMKSRVKHITGDDEILSYLYQSAIALIYPSTYEGFGIPPLEAMRLNCPVIASNSSSIPEICGDSIMYFDCTSTESLQVALLQLIKNPGHYSTEKARSQSLNYSWENTAKETLDVYLKAIFGEK